MRRSFYCILLFLLYPARLLAQAPPVQYVFTHLDTRDGLVSEEITGICQDKKGYIWISTVSGLQRYDGYRFISFRHSSNNPKSIPDDYIQIMFQGKNDRLWLFFNVNRVGYIDQTDLSFHEIPVHTNLENWVIQAAYMFQDYSGNVMIRLFPDGNIYTYNEKAHEFSASFNPFTWPQTWKAVWVTQDKTEGNYWISCDSGLVKYNTARKTISYAGHNTDHDKIIEAFSGLRHTSQGMLDGSGRFWIYSWAPSGPGPFIYSFDTKSGQKKEWEQQIYLLLNYRYHELNHINEEEDGSIWMTGLNMFIKLGKGTDHFEPIPNNSPGEFSIRYDLIRCLYQDREKNIWVASDKGLFRFNPSAQLFQVINNRRPERIDSVYTPEISDILQVKSGDILVNTWGNGLFTYDKNFNPVNRPYVAAGFKLGETLNWCIYQRDNGDIWRGSQDGYIYISEAGTNSTKLIRDPVSENSTIRQITGDKEGNLWLGTHSGLLIKWDHDSNKFILIQRLSTVLRLYTDKQGDIWVCTIKKGVFHINPADGSIISNYIFNGPDEKKLMTIGASDIVQYNDSIYLIASGGLNILNVKTGKIDFLTTDGGLPSNSINNILLDKEGYIWLTTNNRLCRFSLTKSVISTFNEDDGIPTGNFMAGTSAMLADGRLAFGRSHDLVVFDPALIRPDNIPGPGIEITGFFLMNARLPLDSLEKLNHIQLRYNENSISIGFSTLTYLNHFSVSYMLEGLEKDWTTATGSSQAIYNYLPPGDYTFKVKLSNSPADKPVMATLKIYVRAPFWKAWWFYSILALIAAGLFYWEDRERMNRKESVQKMRSDIAGNLHEEINTALSNINVLSEIARIKADKDPEQSKTYINEIHEKSHDMIIAMDDMLWSLDPQNDNMSKTIDRIKEFADALRNRHGVLINLQSDAKVASLKADMKTRHEVMIIYKLALRLLVEEMHAPQTSIQLDINRSQLQLNIFAHNKKLPAENNRVIQAIEEMKERAASIKAALEIQSDEKGTGVILAVRS